MSSFQHVNLLLSRDGEKQDNENDILLSLFPFLKFGMCQLTLGTEHLLNTSSEPHMNAKEVSQWIKLVAAKHDDLNSISGRLITPTNFLLFLHLCCGICYIPAHTQNNTQMRTLAAKLDSLGFSSKTHIGGVDNRHLQGVLSLLHAHHDTGVHTQFKCFLEVETKKTKKIAQLLST